MLDEAADELTESIKEVATGRSYATVISPATVDDLVAAATEWRFDWVREIATTEVFKLTAPKLGRLIHGLISLSLRKDFLWINIIESHPENIGRRKKYFGVPANLVAYACHLAFDRGYGWICFVRCEIRIDRALQTVMGRATNRSNPAHGAGSKRLETVSRTVFWRPTWDTLKNQKALTSTFAAVL